MESGGRVRRWKVGAAWSSPRTEPPDNFMLPAASVRLRTAIHITSHLLAAPISKA